MPLVDLRGEVGQAQLGLVELARRAERETVPDDRLVATALQDEQSLQDGLQFDGGVLGRSDVVIAAEEDAPGGEVGPEAVQDAVRFTGVADVRGTEPPDAQNAQRPAGLVAVNVPQEGVYLGLSLLGAQVGLRRPAPRVEAKPGGGGGVVAWDEFRGMRRPQEGLRILVAGVVARQSRQLGPGTADRPGMARRTTTTTAVTVRGNKRVEAGELVERIRLDNVGADLVQVALGLGPRGELDGGGGPPDCTRVWPVRGAQRGGEARLRGRGRSSSAASRRHESVLGWGGSQEPGSRVSRLTLPVQRVVVVVEAQAAHGV